MSDLKHYIKCDNCGNLIELDSLKLEAQIVSKDIEQNINGEKRKLKIVAVRYYLVCQKCGTEHTCFYKDAVVNSLFDQNKQMEAQQRMEILWEIFENGG